jgi:membrane protein DedA with SNARE-associated domain
LFPWSNMLGTSIDIQHFPYLGIFALLIFGGIGFPFPEDTTLILSGFLLAHGMVKPVPLLLVVYLGLLLSDFFLYWMGRKYGRKIVEYRRFQKIVTHQRLSKLENDFNQRGVLVILFGRHFLGLRAQIFLVAGVMRMHPIKFLITDAITSLFTIALMGGIGYVGGNSIQVLKKDLTRMEHIAILFFIMLLLIWIVFRYLKGYRSKFHG